MLTSDALSRESASALRLRQNARAIRQYEAKWGGDRIEIRERPSLSLRFGDVRISAHPDLYVVTKNSAKIIKLEFSERASNPKVFEIMSQCMFEAAQLAGMPVLGKNVLVYDIPPGHIYKGARFGSRTAKDIEAACETISAVWERI